MLRCFNLYIQHSVVFTFIIFLIGEFQNANSPETRYVWERMTDLYVKVTFYDHERSDLDKLVVNLSGATMSTECF